MPNLTAAPDFPENLQIRLENHNKSTSRPNFAIIPNSFDIKNTPNLTAPPESPEDLQNKFKNHKTNIFFVKICVPPGKLGGPLRDY